MFEQHLKDSRSIILFLFASGLSDNICQNKAERYPREELHRRQSHTDKNCRRRLEDQIEQIICGRESRSFGTKAEFEGRRCVVHSPWKQG